MKVSMDGLRRNLAAAYIRTVEGFREITEDRNLSEFLELKEGLDDLRQMIGGFMCVYSDNPEDMMSDLSDESDDLPFADPDDDDDDEAPK
jgi:hypothetical protein